MIWAAFHVGLLSFLPACSSGLGCDFMTLGCGHGLKATFSANLTPFATDGSHVLGEVNADIGSRGRIGRLLWGFVSGTIYDPFGKLVRVARAFSFFDSHDPMMPQAGMLKRPYENRN